MLGETRGRNVMTGTLRRATTFQLAHTQNLPPHIYSQFNHLKFFPKLLQSYLLPEQIPVQISQKKYNFKSN